MLRLAILLSAAALLVSGSVVRPHHKLHKSIHPLSPVGEKNLKTLTCTLLVVLPKSAVGTCPVPQGATPVYLPDSESCTIFYECDAEGNACQKECPPGTEFNPTLHVCDNPANSGCTADGSKPVFRGKPKTIHPFSPVGTCPDHEDGEPTYLPDSENCKIYYECSNGVPVQLECPDHLEWDPIGKACVTADQSTCTAGKPLNVPKAIEPFSPVGTCPPHEDGEPTYLPDSEKCDVYYVCSNGMPYRNYCTGGTYWNSDKNICDFAENVNCKAGSSKRLPKIVHLPLII